MYKGQSIAVIIPCLNEEQGIERVLRAMPEFVDEVIVVDNASTDRTSDVAASLGAKVIREDVRGYGRAYNEAEPPSPSPSVAAPTSSAASTSMAGCMAAAASENRLGD